MRVITLTTNCSTKLRPNSQELGWAFEYGFGQKVGFKEVTRLAWTNCRYIEKVKFARLPAFEKAVSLPHFCRVKNRVD